jgi:hypothetical protein
MQDTKASTSNAIRKYERITKSLRMISYAALALGILAIVVSAAAVVFLLNQTPKIIYQNVTTTIPQNAINFGSTLAGIDTPLNATQLSIINNAPDSYFEEAGAKYLNESISNPIYTGSNKVAKFLANNKTSVIYLGSTTCIFCGENRWAMALALSRFGNFSRLFYGYSSLGDGDVPTLYWTQLNYNASSDDIGNYYSSPYISFVSIEDTNPITGGFSLNSPSKIATDLAQLGNATYVRAFSYILNLSTNNATAFKGTPYTIWGTAQFSGADAIDFGNTTPVGTPQLTYMTHSQILSQLASPNDQFAWTEYAAADVYIAALCNSLGNSTSAAVPACSLPAIKQLQLQFK